MEVYDWLSGTRGDTNYKIKLYPGREFFFPCPGLKKSCEVKELPPPATGPEWVPTVTKKAKEFDH